MWQQYGAEFPLKWWTAVRPWWSVVTLAREIDDLQRCLLRQERDDFRVADDTVRIGKTHDLPHERLPLGTVHLITHSGHALVRGRHAIARIRHRTAVVVDPRTLVLIVLPSPAWVTTDCPPLVVAWLLPGLVRCSGLISTRANPR